MSKYRISLHPSPAALSACCRVAVSYCAVSDCVVSECDASDCYVCPIVTSQSCIVTCQNVDPQCCDPIALRWLSPKSPCDVGMLCQIVICQSVLCRNVMCQIVMGECELRMSTHNATSLQSHCSQRNAYRAGPACTS
eukprot:1202513-Rhodomonas_salina.1